MFSSPSPLLTSIAAFLFVLLLLMAKPMLAIRNLRFNNKRGLYIMFFIVYGLLLIFAFNSADFYSYADAFRGHDKITYFEPFYNWLAEVLDNNYILWRAIVWGTSVYLIYLSALRSNIIQNRNYLLALALFGFGLDVYTRGILGHTVLLLAVVLLADDKNRIVEKLLGITLLFISLSLHKSMFVNVAFALIAILPIAKRNIIKILILLFPFLTIAATAIIDNAAAGLIDFSAIEEMDSGASDRIIFYASGEKVSQNLNGTISLAITLIPEYLSLIYITKRVVYENYFSGIAKERLYMYLFKLTFVAMYISSLFYFVETSSWIYSRFKYMAFFPLVIVMAKLWSLEKRSRNLIKWIISLQAMSILIMFLLSIIQLR